MASVFVIDTRSRSVIDRRAHERAIRRRRARVATAVGSTVDAPQRHPRVRAPILPKRAALHDGHRRARRQSVAPDHEHAERSSRSRRLDRRDGVLFGRSRKHSRPGSRSTGRPRQGQDRTRRRSVYNVSITAIGVHARRARRSARRARDDRFRGHAPMAGRPRSVGRRTSAAVCSRTTMASRVAEAGFVIRLARADSAGLEPHGTSGTREPSATSRSTRKSTRTATVHVSGVSDPTSSASPLANQTHRWCQVPPLTMHGPRALVSSSTATAERADRPLPHTDWGGRRAVLPAHDGRRTT